MSQYHVIDPTFFFDALDLFAFEVEWYHVKSRTINEYGYQKDEFEKLFAYGSLQSEGNTLEQNKEGNTSQWNYNFYCRSMTRIEIGDFLVYKHKLLHVDSVRDLDEWGVRSCSCTMVTLTAYKDLQDYIYYLTGQKLI